MTLKVIKNVAVSPEYEYRVVGVEPKMIQDPVDAKNGVPFGESEQVQKQTNDVPVWTIEVKAAHPHVDGGVMSVSVPSKTEPKLEFGDTVNFTNLTAGAWGANGRSGMFFMAEGCRPVGGNHFPAEQSNGGK